MVGDRTIFDILYGERIDEGTLSSLSARVMLEECLIYDNEVELDYMQQARKRGPEKEGNIKIIQQMPIHEAAMLMKYPELQDAIVTLLSIEEYLELDNKT